MSPGHALRSVHPVLATLLPACPPADLLALLVRDLPILDAAAAAIVRRGQTLGVPLTRLGIAPLPASLRQATVGTSHWVLLPAEEDPLLQDPDGYPIPERVLRDLRRLADGGVAFDALYIVHELSYREAEPWPQALIPQPSVAMVQRGDRLAAHAARVWGRALSPLRRSGGRRPAPAGPAITGLDPLVLGVLLAPGRAVCAGELALWVGIARWSYDQHGE